MQAITTVISWPESTLAHQLWCRATRRVQSSNPANPAAHAVPSQLDFSRVATFATRMSGEPANSPNGVYQKQISAVLLQMAGLGFLCPGTC